MSGLPKVQRGAVARTCWTLGGGGAGGLAILAMAHSPSVSVAVVVSLAIAFAGNAIASLSAALPDIITALNAKRVAQIKARADAQVALERAQQRSVLINAGLEGNLDAALSLLRLQPLDGDVLVDPRLGDERLRALLPEPRTPCDEDPGAGRPVRRCARSA